jgi:hypothetical protein
MLFCRQEVMPMLTITIPATVSGLGWTVVLGPLAGVAVLAVFGVFVFLVVGAAMQLGAMPDDIDPQPPVREPVLRDRAAARHPTCWNCGERLVA